MLQRLPPPIPKERTEKDIFFHPESKETNSKEKINPVKKPNAIPKKLNAIIMTPSNS